MAKIVTVQDLSETESLRLTIGLADNGIIIRNRDCDDDVMLALTGPGTRKPDGYGYDIDHSNEYSAIGKKVFDWLDNYVRIEQGSNMVVTGFDLDISAKCVGREIEE